jgi:hypothetical protein
MVNVLPLGEKEGKKQDLVYIHFLVADEPL